MVLHKGRTFTLAWLSLAPLACSESVTPPEPFECGAELGGLEIHGSLTLTLVEDPNIEAGYHAHEFEGYFELINDTDYPASITKQILLFATPGGYSVSAGTHIWWSGITSRDQQRRVGPFSWTWSAPLAHLVVRTDGTTGDCPIHAVGAVPLLAAGFAAPEAEDFSGDGVLDARDLAVMASQWQKQAWWK